jgi:hypothetical protein
MVYVRWGLPALALGFLMAAIIQWRAIHRKLTVHRAIWYGDDPGSSKNKTQIVRGWIDEDSIHHPVHQDELGDDPRGQAKKLEILSIGRVKRKTLVVLNGKTLVIPEPSSSVGS